MTTSISPDQTRMCALCSRPATDEHHIIHRSMGGTDHEHNIATICRQCHQNLHGEKGGVGWRLDRQGNVLRVWKGAELLAERWSPPSPKWQGNFVAVIQSAPEALMAAVDGFKFLDEDGIRAVGTALKDLDRTNWIVRAQLLAHAIKRTPYGTRTERLEQVARDIGMRKSQAYSDLSALETVEQYGELFQHAGNLPGPDMINLAARQENPEAALTLLVERRIERPTYGRSQFKAELEQDTTEYCYGPCERCGAVSKHKLEGK